MESRLQHFRYKPITGPEEIEAQPNFGIKIIPDEPTPLSLLRTLALA